MPRINLLPWRAELRKKRRNQFFIGLGGAVVGAALVVLIANLVMNFVIDEQRERNQILKTEIAALDERIKEILDLEARRDSLLARMEIIERLQHSRPEIVHVFDQVVRTLPDGVHLTTISQTGTRLEITGLAESNTRVSAFMRNIEKSGWLKEPDLKVVEVKGSGRGKTEAALARASEFTVFANQVSAPDGEDVP